MKRTSSEYTALCLRCFALLPVLALAACGGGNGDAASARTTTLGTLAYVVSECREGADGNFQGQTLRVQQGDRDPVTVFEVPTVGPLPAIGLCPLFGGLGAGGISVFASPFQRLGATPDGSGVVFEVTDDFSNTFPNLLVPPELEGIYYVRADGSGLRRLGPHSRQPSFRIIGTGSEGATETPFFEFSPDGRSITFADMGIGPAGEEALQVFTQNIITRERTQITHLPYTEPKDQLDYVVLPPFFIGDRTISFVSNINPNDLNPDRDDAFFAVNTDGSNLRLAASFADIVLPSGQVQPHFSITGSGRFATSLSVTGVPQGPTLPGLGVLEVFVGDGTNLLQLTSFRRGDTGNFGVFVTVDGQRVVFTASADPFGTNPTAECQLFSVDILGTDLRQLTKLSSGKRSRSGCTIGLFGPRCAAGTFGNGYAPSQDARTGAIIFDSSCDGAGNVFNGEQLFAVNPDGSGLRQLTHTRGMITAPGGSVSVELPGPYVYGPYR